MKVLGADHPRLAQHGVEGLDRRLGVPDLVPRRHPEAAGSALDDDRRLHPREATRDAGELPRVADALQVQADGAGSGVLGPELHHVVAGHVRPVAGGHERAEAQPAPIRAGQHRDAQRT